MSQPVSRRNVLKTISAASAGAVLAPAVLRGQSSSILVNGKPVEIAITSVSASTVRISVLPIATTPANVRNDGALVAAATGRALWLHHSDDPQAVARGDQFLWGRDILVSPVVEKGATSRRLYLPKGKWFDFWTEQPVDGGREIDRPVDLETMPLHVRAGAIIPMDPVRQHVDEEVSDPLSLTVYPGANGAFELYDDDGQTFAHRRGEFTRLAMRWNDAARRLSISLTPGSKMLVGSLLIEARIAGTTTKRGVLFEGKPVEWQL
jgi:hypothetical protein